MIFKLRGTFSTLSTLANVPQQHFTCRIFPCNGAFIHCGKAPEYFCLLATEIRCLSKCSLLTLICVCFDRSMSSFWWWRCTRWWNIPPPWNPTHPGSGVSGEPCRSWRSVGRPVAASSEAVCACVACVWKEKSYARLLLLPPPWNFKTCCWPTGSHDFLFS